MQQMVSMYVWYSQHVCGTVNLYICEVYTQLMGVRPCDCMC